MVHIPEDPILTNFSRVEMRFSRKRKREFRNYRKFSREMPRSRSADYLEKDSKEEVEDSSKNASTNEMKKI